MVDARNFLLNSEFPMDQIAGFLSGSFTVANGNIQTADIAHNLPFTPLPIGSWSYSATFDTSFPTITDYNGNGARPSVTMQANGSVLRITSSNYTGGDKQIFWRCFFLIPSTVDPDIPSTAVNSLNLSFSTDYNYTKLLKEGYVTSSGAINHSLQYRPQVALWGQLSNGFVQQYEICDARPSPSDAAEVTATDLILTIGSFVGVHYRIYGDAS